MMLFERPEPRRYLPLLALAAMTAVLGLFGEAQPRYLFPAWFVLPLYPGLLLARPEPGRPSLREARERALEVLVVALVVGLAVVLSVAGLRGRLEAGWPRLIETRRASYSGAALPWGRYRALLAEDSLAVTRIDLPSSGRVTALAARTIHARLPCSTAGLHLFVNDRPSGVGTIDSAKVSAMLTADLRQVDGDTATLTVSTSPPSSGTTCPLMLWLLYSRE
jgi:hypothetical protein